jgi:hypothetical protein
MQSGPRKESSVLLPRGVLVGAMSSVESDEGVRELERAMGEGRGGVGGGARKASRLLKMAASDRGKAMLKMEAKELEEIAVWASPQDVAKGLGSLGQAQQQAVVSKIAPEKRSPLVAKLGSVERAWSLSGMQPAHRTVCLRGLSSRDVLSALDGMTQVPCQRLVHSSIHKQTK